MSTRNTYSIGETSAMTGVSQRQLRDWEGKYIPEPNRISVCDRLYRRYTLDDIRLLKKIQKNLAKGFTLSAAAKNAAATEINQEEAIHEE
jgi:DNA-binding transcriptional MerR regulator